MDLDYLNVSDGTGEAILASIENDRPAANMTLDVNSVDNWPAKFIFATGTLLPNNYIDPTTMKVMYGHLDSGNIIIDSFAPGYTDTGNTEGQVAVIKPNTEWGNLVANAAQQMDAFIEEQGDWRSLGVVPTVATGYNKGQKSFDLLFSGANYSTLLSPGMRFKVDRSVAAPTLVPDFAVGSTQYATRASGSVTGFAGITDDVTVEAWVKPRSYSPTVQRTIFSRYTGGNGIIVRMDIDGRVSIGGWNNPSNRTFQSVQSLPLNEWTHIALTLDMSGAVSNMYFNGVSVPTNNIGLTATSFVQAGNLQIGALDGGDTWDGAISDVRFWNVVRTATQVRDNMYNQLVGTETNLVGYWKLTTNFQDSTTNGNHLTAMGGVAIASADNPFHTTEYGIIQSVTYSAPNTTVNVFTGNKNNIPLMTLANPKFSTVEVPYGFPAARENWRVETIIKAQDPVSIGAVDQWWASKSRLTVPVGEWQLGYQGNGQVNSSVAGVRSGFITLASTTTPPVNSDESEYMVSRIFSAASVVVAQASVSKNKGISLTAADTYGLYFSIDSATGSEAANIRGDQGAMIIYAQNGYI